MTPIQKKQFTAFILMTFVSLVSLGVSLGISLRVCVAQEQEKASTLAPPPSSSTPPIEVPGVEVKKDEVQKYIREIKKQKKIQEKVVAELSEKFEDAKGEYEVADQEYQKIKTVSRDWDRRNKAEEEFLKSYTTFQEAQKIFEASKLKLGLLAQELETLSGKMKVPSGESSNEKFLDFPNFQDISIKFLLVLILILFPTLYIFSDLWTSLGAWFVIRSQSGFKRGDHIKLGTLEGDVVHIGFFRTTLLEPSQNHTIYFLNNLILKHPLILSTKKST